MTKSELIKLLARQQTHLGFADIELAVKNIIEQMRLALSHGERIEVRGFGGFSLHYRPPRMGRNPKTGGVVALPGKHIPHFKPGKQLRERVNTRHGFDSKHYSTYSTAKRGLKDRCYEMGSTCHL